jgi:hypothetical protein
MRSGEKILAALATVFVVAGLLSCRSNFSAAPNGDQLVSLQRGIENDVRVGQEMREASDIIVNKYHARNIDLSSSEGGCDRSFNINGASDKNGVYSTLMIRVQCRDGRVSGLETAVVGNGP